MRCCRAAPLRGSAYNLPSRSPPIVLTLLEAALILPSPISFTVRARRVSTRGWVHAVERLLAVVAWQLRPVRGE